MNLAGEELVDMKQIAEAIKQGIISQYVGESLTPRTSPLSKLEQAHITKPYSYLTREARRRKLQEWATQIANLAGKGSS